MKGYINGNKQIISIKEKNLPRERQGGRMKKKFFGG